MSSTLSYSALNYFPPSLSSSCAIKIVLASLTVSPKLQHLVRPTVSLCSPRKIQAGSPPTPLQLPLPGQVCLAARGDTREGLWTPVPSLDLSPGSIGHGIVLLVFTFLVGRHLVTLTASR